MVCHCLLQGGSYSFLNTGISSIHKHIPRYFTLFHVTINETVFSDSSLLLYRKCKRFLYIYFVSWIHWWVLLNSWWTLLNSLMSSNSFLMMSLELSMENMSSADSDNFTSSFSIWILLFLSDYSAMWETWVRSLGWEDPLEKGKASHSSILAWRIAGTLQSMGAHRVGYDGMTFTFTLARTSNTMLNQSGKSENPHSVADLRRNVFSFSPLSMMLVVGLSDMAFVMLRYVPSIHAFWVFYFFLSQTDAEFCQSLFCIYWD